MTSKSVKYVEFVPHFIVEIKVFLLFFLRSSRFSILCSAGN